MKKSVFESSVVSFKHILQIKETDSLCWRKVVFAENPDKKSLSDFWNIFLAETTDPVYIRNAVFYPTVTEDCVYEPVGLAILPTCEHSKEVINPAECVVRICLSLPFFQNQLVIELSDNEQFMFDLDENRNPDIQIDGHKKYIISRVSVDKIKKFEMFGL